MENDERVRGVNADALMIAVEGRIAVFLILSRASWDMGEYS